MSQLGFCLGFIVVEMVALGFNHQNHPAVCHGYDVGVGVKRTVDLEAEAGNVPVPPLDIG